MAQSDIFERMSTPTNGRTLREAANTANISDDRQRRDKEDLYNVEMQMHKLKKKNLEIDFKTNGLFKGLAKMMSRLGKQNEDYLKNKKSVKNLEKDILKNNELLKKEMEKANGQQSDKVDFLKKQTDEMEYQVRLDRLRNQQMKRMLPLGGALSGTMGVITKSAGIFNGVMESVSSIFKFLMTPIRMISDTIMKVWETFLKVQSITGNLAADIGLTSKESYKFKDNFADLAISALNFGGTMEDVATIMSRFSEETNKNKMFDKESLEGIMELAKGTGLGVEGATEMAASFDNIGMSIKQTVDYTDKARNIAARFNLNATKFLQSTGAFLKQFQGFGFKNGLEGITKMMAKAQSLRYDLGSIKGIADKLFDPEGAIEASAQLQVLGGRFSKLGDPFNLMYAAQNAPEELANGIMEATKGMAKKGADGIFRISPMDRRIIAEAANAIGESADNLINSAIEQGKMLDKMGASKFLRKGIFNEEDRMAIGNLMSVNAKGQYTIRMPDGFDQLVSEIPNKSEFRKILDLRKKNDEAAIERKNWSERFNLILEKFMLAFTTPFIKMESIFKDTNLITKIEEFGKNLALKIIPLFQSIFTPGGGLYTFIDKFSAAIGSVLDGANKILKNGGTFWDVIKSGFMGVIEVITPFLQQAFGVLFESMKNIPLIGDRLGRVGLEMQYKASRKNDDIAKMNGLDRGNTSGQADFGNKMKTSYDRDGIGVGTYAKNAAIGAAIGSVLPVIGTATGAALGLLYAAYEDITEKSPQEKLSDFQSKVINVNDGVMTPSGDVIKYPKGELLSIMSPKQNMSSAGGGASSIQLSGSVKLDTPVGSINLTLEDFKKAGLHLITAAITHEQDKTSKGYGLNDSRDIKTTLAI